MARSPSARTAPPRRQTHQLRTVSLKGDRAGNMHRRTPSSIREAPQALSCLAPEVKLIFDRWAKRLEATGMSSESYGDALSLYCAALNDYILARNWMNSFPQRRDTLESQIDDMLRERASLKRNKTDDAKRPEVNEKIMLAEAAYERLLAERKIQMRVMKDAEATVAKIGPEFGWSPLARGRVEIGDAPEATSSLDKYRAG